MIRSLLVCISVIYSFSGYGMNLLSSEKKAWYTSYDIKYYGIDIKVPNDEQYVRASVTILVEISNEVPDSLRLELSNDLMVDTVTYQKSQVSFNHQDNILAIAFPHEMKAKEKVSFRIAYHGPVQSNGFYTAYSYKKDFKWQKNVTFTLSEPYGAKYWFPCKMDNTDKADSVAMYITVPKGLKAVSNGLLQRIVKVDAEHERFEWKTHYPIAHYLISLVVGDFKEYNFYSPIGNKDSVFVQNFVYQNVDIQNDLKDFKANTSSLLAYYSQTFGRYPFAAEKYGHSMAPVSGGMENQTATTLSNFDFYLLAHEMAHQWFGNLVTCSDFHNLWVNEGFASYCEYLAIENIQGREAGDKWMISAQKSALHCQSKSVFVENALEDEQIAMFNYNLTYKKGAAVLHMLRYEINNDQVFNAILRRYLETYRFRTASVDDFMKVVAQLTQQDYSWFSRQWVYGKGNPFFDLSWKQIADSLVLVVSQRSTDDGNPYMKTHFDLKITDANMHDSIVRLWCDLPAQRFSIKTNTLVKSVSFDPNLWLLKEAVVDKVPDLPSINDSTLLVEPVQFGRQITLSFAKEGRNIRKVKLIDMNGKVYLQTSIARKSQQKIDTGDLPSGSYLLYVTEGKKLWVRKITKA